MKKTAAALAAIITLAAFSHAFAQSGPTPFTLIIAGTRSIADVESVKGSLKRVSGIQGLTQTGASQMRIEFSGNYAGTEEALSGEIESIAADRFDVTAKSNKQRGFVITMRKLPPAAPAAK